MLTNKFFPLVSGHLSLDLVNTEIVKRGIRHDLLVSEKDLANWIKIKKESGILFSNQFDEKSLLSNGLSTLRDLRTFLREGFEEIADGKQLDDKWKSHLEDLTEQAPLSFKLLSESLLPV
ncbi:hypothetical protein CR203_22755, partial [Salipaludibacillus neizhouensis]